MGAVWNVGTYVEPILGLSGTMLGRRRRAGIEVEIMCIRYWGDAWVCKDGMWSINDLVSGHPLAFSCFLETGYGSGCLSWGQTPVVPSACQRAWPQPKHSPHPKLPACSHQTPVGLGLVSLVLPAQGSPTLGAALFSHQHSGRSVCLESQAQRLLLWAWSHAPHVSSICWPIGCSGVGSLFLF